jgi:23S rRNA (adenine2503-C2)-methyltransferase
MPERIPIKTIPLEELKETLAGHGFARYRAAQIFHWLYRKYAISFDEMTNIAKAQRQRLSDLFVIDSLRTLQVERSADGTQKFLFGLSDGHTIESVLIPDLQRLTLCVSSQVGCRQACRFCLTGASGFVRDLRSWEITDQVLAVSRALHAEARPRITNIVLMGMGEPLDNYEEVVRALATITDERAVAFSARRVTLSTAGLVPNIDRLGSAGLKVNLAISLNASTDVVRERIMPVNRRWPLRELLAACRRYPLEPRRRITFEYVLLRGVNDAAEDARRVAALLKGIRCKVNLIPFNRFPGCAFERPQEETVRRFQQILLAHHYTAPVRESRGRDISAACGQLREHASLLPS